MLYGVTSDYSKRDVHDFFSTDPVAVYSLLDRERFTTHIWEPACGSGNIVNVLRDLNFSVFATDIVDRGCCDQLFDFLKEDFEITTDLITNPPYSKATEFVRKTLDSMRGGFKAAFLLRLSFLEGQARRELFDLYPPEKIYVFSKRLACYKDGIVDPNLRSAVSYAWFIWTKGYNGYPVVDWI